MLPAALSAGCDDTVVGDDGRAPGRWLGVVLCGGVSARMGRDKAQLEIDGEPLYARIAGVLGELCAEVVLASGPTPRLGDPRWREIADTSVSAPDRADGRQGPLAALIAGLALAAEGGYDGILTAPCDVPRLAAATLLPLQQAVAQQPRESLHGATGRPLDVAHWRRGERAEPLCAALSVRALEPLAAAFARGVRRPTEAFAELRAQVHEAPGTLSETLTNVNTPDDLARCARSAGLSHPGPASATNPPVVGRVCTGGLG